MRAKRFLVGLRAGGLIDDKPKRTGKNSFSTVKFVFLYPAIPRGERLVII